jgi:hypothetical protein
VGLRVPLPLAFATASSSICAQQGALASATFPTAAIATAVAAATLAATLTAAIFATITARV